MYIWVGINLDNQLEKLRCRAQKIEKDIGFSRTALDLPLHISLKISFFVEDGRYMEAVKDILSFYRTLMPATAETDRIEQADGFIWLRYKENSYLEDIHEKLNFLLEKKYGVPRHMFDDAFIYHSTLLTDDNGEKLSDAYARMEDAEYPKSVNLARFLVGLSPDGAWDTYKVFREIEIAENEITDLILPK